MAIGKPRKPNGGIPRLTAPPAVRRGSVPTYQGIDVAERILDRAESGKTLIYFDPDVDGMVAGFFFAMVLMERGITYKTYINPQRRHGFLLEPDTVKGWTVVNGDFLVPRSIVQDMVSKDVNLLSIDHHECEPDLIHEVGAQGNEGIVINNQYASEPKYLEFQSGAGVTFEALREIHPWLDTKQNRALVGISLLTDIRNIQNEWAAGYLHELYNSKYEGFLGYLIDSVKPKRDFHFGVPKFDRNFVDYTFGPAVNSMLRYNEEESAVKFILGGGYPKREFRIEQRSFVEAMIKKAKVTELDHLKVLEVYEEDFDYEGRSLISNFIGVLCSRFSGNGFSCIGIVYDLNGNVMRSSFRGNLQKSAYLDGLNSILTGIGHNIAFGIVDINPSEELWKKADAICAEAELGTSYRQRWLGIEDLSKFTRSDIVKLAELNSYLMGANRIYLRYRGEEVDRVRSGSKFTEYSIDGVKVMCFNKGLVAGYDYILPMLDRNRVNFYLDSAYNEKYALEIQREDINLGDDWYKRLD